MKKKYLIQCRCCGTILLKVENPTVSMFDIEIKCPNLNCKKMLKLPGDAIVTLDQTKKRFKIQ